MPRLIVRGFTISPASVGQALCNSTAPQNRPWRFSILCGSLGLFPLFLGCQLDSDPKLHTWNERIAGVARVHENREANDPIIGGTDVQLSAQLGGIVYSDTARVVHVITTLYNPTADTLRFISLSCSYEDMFVVGGNEGYALRPRFDCFKNAPTVQVLPPRTHLDQFIMVAAMDKSTMIHKGRLKIGLLWMDPSEHKDIFSAYQRRKELGRVVWSNDLDLERLYRKPYK